MISAPVKYYSLSANHSSLSANHDGLSANHSSLPVMNKHQHIIVFMCKAEGMSKAECIYKAEGRKLVFTLITIPSYRFSTLKPSVILVTEARVYDPLTHFFLTKDPLPPIPGTPYAANPYEYTGHNPLTLLDPLGLKGITDAKLNQLTNYNNTRQKSFLDKYGAYIAVGLTLAVGIGLMFIPGGQGAGAIALSAAAGGLTAGGLSIIKQKASKGSINFKDLALDAVLGLFAGGALGAMYELRFFKEIAEDTKDLSLLGVIATRTTLYTPFTALATYVTSIGQEAANRWFNNGHDGSFIDGVNETFKENIGLNIFDHPASTIGEKLLNKAGK